MSLRGHIRNGVVILDGPTTLPDGTPVSVEPLSDPSPHLRGSPARILETLCRLGPFKGDPGAWDAALEDLRRSKQESLALELDREKLNGDLP